ncbi:hypothetical protein D9M72_300720 [compost metagenome]
MESFEAPFALKSIAVSFQVPFDMMIRSPGFTLEMASFSSAMVPTFISTAFALAAASRKVQSAVMEYFMFFIVLTN